MSTTREEALKLLEDDSEDYSCIFCKRVILAGPICCYDKAVDLYKKSRSEVLWYRKVQSKKDKKIHELQNKIKELQSKE